MRPRDDTYLIENVDFPFFLRKRDRQTDGQTLL